MALKIKLPEPVGYIINTLEANGYEAYTVGGCVRDSLLGVHPKDWDVCTSALPEQTMECFKQHHIIETGLKHGTITLVLDHQPFEITTYRVDGKYKGYRRPDTVTFVNVLKRDLARRDFTVSAMAYNPKTGLVDYYNGQQDLAEKRIKCVGNADKRFGEDALRIMRALRFASVLGFSIEDGTSDSIFRNMELLHNISTERLTDELYKLMDGDSASSIISKYTPVVVKAIPEIIPSKKHVTRLLKKIGENMLRRLLEIKNDGEALAVLDEIIKQQSFPLKDLAVNGKDVIAAGVPPGVQVGEILSRLLETVIDGQAPNDRDDLLGIVRQLMSAL